MIKSNVWGLMIGIHYEPAHVIEYYSTEGKCYKALMGNLNSEILCHPDGRPLSKLPLLNADYYLIGELSMRS